MKKAILFVLLLITATIALSCEPTGDPARLYVFNDTGKTLTGLYLTGEENTENLLSGDGLNADEVAKLSAQLTPGTYEWRVESEDDEEYKNNKPIELFPGRNNLRISVDSGDWN